MVAARCATVGAATAAAAASSASTSAPARAAAATSAAGLTTTSATTTTATSAGRTGKAAVTSAATTLAGQGSLAVYAHVTGSRRGIEAITDIVVNAVVGIVLGAIKWLKSGRLLAGAPQVTNQVFVVRCIFRCAFHSRRRGRHGFTGLARSRLLLALAAIRATWSTRTITISAPPTSAFTSAAPASAAAIFTAAAFFIARASRIGIDFGFVVVNEI